MPACVCRDGSRCVCKETFTIEEYRSDPGWALDCAGELGRVEVVDENGEIVFSIDRRNPPSLD